jgi:hypothetical protein
MDAQILLIRILNAKGPKVDCCGTPDFTVRLRRRKGAKDMNRGLSGGQVAMNLINVTRGSPKLPNLQRSKE